LKTIRLVIAGVLILAGCGKQADFTITGKISGSVKDSLVIEELTDKSMEFRSTIVTSDDGSFSYSDTASNPRLLVIKNSQNEYFTLMVLNGEKIKVTAEKGKIIKTLNITGSHQSELIMELSRELLRASITMDSLGKQYQEIKGRGNDAQIDTWIQSEFGKLLDQQRAFIRAFIDRNVNEPACLLALSHQIGRQSVLNGSKDFDLFEKVDASLSKKYPEAPLIRNLHRYVEMIHKQKPLETDSQAVIAIGSDAPEIALPDPAGKTRSLSSLKGKIVLLDFWAGWCSPCRRENPGLVSVYKKYHDKGFEIYQVSLDRKKEEWEAAIKQDGLNWIQVSDLKFWSSPVVRQYGIVSIPANFLLNKEGKVIATNLRSTTLDEELSKILH